MTTVAESVRGLTRLTTVPDKLIQGTDGPLSWELRRAQNIHFEVCFHWKRLETGAIQSRLSQRPSLSSLSLASQARWPCCDSNSVRRRWQRIPSLGFPRIHHLRCWLSQRCTGRYFPRTRHATLTRMHFPDSKTLTGVVIVRHVLPLFTSDRERRGEGVQLRSRAKNRLPATRSRFAGDEKYSGRFPIDHGSLVRVLELEFYNGSKSQ